MPIGATAIIVAVISATPPTLVALLALRRTGEVKTAVAAVDTAVHIVKADVAEVKVRQEKVREDLATTLNGVVK